MVRAGKPADQKLGQGLHVSLEVKGSGILCQIHHSVIP